jgi:YlmC/YmxH family sporulation protein
MQCRIADLRCKEVINIHTGFRLGFVCDVIINVTSGNVLAILVPGPRRFFGLFGREDDFLIPWECIRRIGDDIILVDIEGDYRREKANKYSWF